MVKANLLEHVAQHVVIDAVVERREVEARSPNVAAGKHRFGGLVESLVAVGPPSIEPQAGRARVLVAKHLAVVFASDARV